MIDLASIRTASFSLTPTGYNPEEVDRFLVELADSAPGEIDLSRVRNASFALTPTGYNPEEVDQFLGSIADQLAATPAPQSVLNEPETSPDHHQAEADVARRRRHRRGRAGARRPGLGSARDRVAARAARA